MTSPRSGRRLGWAAVGVTLAVAALASFLRPAAQQPAPVSATNTSPDPRSCKPTPPVRVTLTAMSRGIWRIRLEAQAAVEEAVLRMGSGAPGAESEVVAVWRGALAAGEAREVEVRYEAPPGEAQVWAEATADERGDALQRSRAAVRTRGGLAVAASEAPADPGQVVADPESGGQVVEYPGGTGGNR